VTHRSYTRYTLRLPAAAVPRGGFDPADEVPDDWSGAAAYTAPHEPLEYAHPEAVALVSSLQPSGWQEEDGGDTIVFWLEDGAEGGARVVEGLVRLRTLGCLDVSPERPGWEDAWRAFHRPQVVGRLYVRPPWYPAREDLLDVAVEAGQGFGTGGHATTRQCLEEIQEIAPGSLLDLGCGSGVVSLAAQRLGFAPVWGVDVDPAAVRSAEENAARNGLAPAFMTGDVTQDDCPLPDADTVVANIALRPILRLARRFTGQGGQASVLRAEHLLLAGLLVEQADEAARAFPGHEELGRRRDGEWSLVHLTRRA
jgi:ribosomal protein L11 methyltransferase